MPPDRRLLEELNEAEDASQVAYLRQLCEMALDQWPDHGPTLLQYAGALTDLALYDDAARILDHAESVISDEERHLVLAQRGLRLRHMGDFAGAEELHLRAHALDPDDSTYLIFAASSAFRRGDILRAEEISRKAIACSVGSIHEALINLGSYLLAQKRYDEARDCYLRALKIDPENARAKRRLADVERVIRKKGEDADDQAAAAVESKD